MPEWLRADIEFAGFYSYRIPNLSPSFAICSPLPSPAAVRLALVDAVIRHTGSVDEGRITFELVKRAQLKLQPPSRIAVIKFFVKRLKPEKPVKGKRTTVLESTGVREYCLPSDSMVIWMETEDPDRMTRAFQWLRRLGTTDSLATCTVGTGLPDSSLCLTPLRALPLRADTLRQRAVVTLHELKPDSGFDQVNPYAEGKTGRPFDAILYMLPLVREGAGQNWIVYRREGFDLS